MGIRRRVDGGTPHNYRNELVTFIESDDGGEPASLYGLHQPGLYSITFLFR